MNRLRRLLDLLAGSTGFESAAREAGYDHVKDAAQEMKALVAGLPRSSGDPEGSGEPADTGLPVYTGRRPLVVNTDGAARGNPGPAAAAAVVFDYDGSEIYSRAVRLGRATNNEAEYRGLILGLDLARDLECREIMVRMDSELVVKQMNGEYKIKKEHLRELARVASGKAAYFDVVRYKHVPRAENSRADKLANDILDAEDCPAE